MSSNETDPSREATLFVSPARELWEASGRPHSPVGTALELRRSPRFTFLRPRSARGQAAVEFALVIVLLIVLVLSMLELILLMHTYNTLADAAKEGVRYAIVHGNGADDPYKVGPTCPCTDIDGPAAPPGTIPGYNSGYGVVKTYAQYSLHNMAGMTVTVNYPDTAPANKAPKRVQVVVAYPVHPLFGLGWPTVTVNAAAEGRIMH